jgi:Polysaccharide deacetylase
MLTTMRSFYREWRQEAAWLRAGCYPPFVTAAAPPVVDDDVPVFVLHTIVPDEFEAQFRFLADNGYDTLSCDAFLRHLTGEAVAPRRSVLLTIDDGRASVWSVALPLLRKYGATATVFLIPGYVSEAAQPSPAMQDLQAGAHLPSRGLELMSWAEIEAAAASGHVDFQAHTLYHHSVPVSDRIVDYVNPEMRHALFDLPIEPGQEEMLLRDGMVALYGAPVYESESLMSGRPRFRGRPELARACMERVARSGASSFFRSPSWRAELDRVVEDWSARNGRRGALEDAGATRRAMVEDLRRARPLIEERLKGHEVRHLCLPYTIGSTDAVDAARGAGYRSCFWGVLPDRRTNRPGQDPYRCPRLKANYIFRLPGRGRRSLAAIVSRKLTRRLSGRPVYYRDSPSHGPDTVSRPLAEAFAVRTLPEER